MTQPIIGPAPLTPEWFAVRRRVASGTAIARWLSGEAFAVYSEMHGDIEPFAGNEFTDDGNDLQPAVLAMYARRAKAIVGVGIPFVIDADCPSLGATLDGIATPSLVDDGGVPKLVDFENVPHLLQDPEAWGVEAKTTTSPAIAKQLGEEESDEVPEKWVWQCQVQSACCRLRWVDVPVLLFGRIKILQVQRNETLIAKCREVATEIVDRVKRGLPPPIDFANPAAQDAIKSLYGVREEQAIDLSTDARTRWLEYQELGKQIKGLEDRRKACQAEVLAEMRDAGAANIGGGLILKRSKVERQSYTVAATSFIQLRQVKAK